MKIIITPNSSAGIATSFDLQELGKEDSVPNETDPIHLSSEKPSFVQENKTGVKEIKDVKKRVKNLVQNLIKNGHCKQKTASTNSIPSTSIKLGKTQVSRVLKVQNIVQKIGKKKKQNLKAHTGSDEEVESFHGFTDSEIETASLKSGRSSIFSSSTASSKKSTISSISSSSKKSSSSSKSPGSKKNNV